jgi:hypothetical protein
MNIRRIATAHTAISPPLSSLRFLMKSGAASVMRRYAPRKTEAPIVPASLNSTGSRLAQTLLGGSATPRTCGSQETLDTSSPARRNAASTPSAMAPPRPRSRARVCPAQVGSVRCSLLSETTTARSSSAPVLVAHGRKGRGVARSRVGDVDTRFKLVSFSKSRADGNDRQHKEPEGSRGAALGCRPRGPEGYQAPEGAPCLLPARRASLPLWHLHGILERAAKRGSASSAGTTSGTRSCPT